MYYYLKHSRNVFITHKYYFLTEVRKLKATTSSNSYHPILHTNQNPTFLFKLTTMVRPLKKSLIKRYMIDCSYPQIYIHPNADKSCAMEFGRMEWTKIIMLAAFLRRYYMSKIIDAITWNTRGRENISSCNRIKAHITEPDERTVLRFLSYLLLLGCRKLKGTKKRLQRIERKWKTAYGKDSLSDFIPISANNNLFRSEIKEPTHRTSLIC